MTTDLTHSKILIVDDRQANVVVLEEFLELKGYINVKSTTDARLVVKIVEEFKPDLLLLDMMMPHFSGVEVMGQLKENSYLENMAILVLTADVSRETKEQALSKGASDFLTKPFDLMEVDLRIKNLLLTVYLLKQLKEKNLNLEEKIKERTAELVETNKAISAQNEQLKQIAWTQSHVVRAPLARLMGLVNLLQSNEELPELNNAQIIEHIVNSANELDNIVKEITTKSFDAKVLNNKNL
jgi:two-component system sensor histidine kinase/response regulator